MGGSVDTDALAKLRVPFPASAVGKLPRITCKACRERKCNQHPPKKCNTCNQYTTTAHIHLSYVGHAALTDRLLDVDPEWTWAPVAVEEDGRPKFDRTDRGQPVGLWIALTVAGMTRLGYGSVDAGKQDAVKELIGDALRNAGMRFGMALDLWSKEELPSVEVAGDGEVTGEGSDPAPATGGRMCTSCGGVLDGPVAKGPDGGYVHKDGCPGVVDPEETTGAPDHAGDEAAHEAAPATEPAPAPKGERTCPLCHDPLTGAAKKVPGMGYAHKECAEKHAA